MWYPIISYHIISCHIISYPIISYVQIFFYRLILGVEQENCDMMDVGPCFNADTQPTSLLRPLFDRYQDLFKSGVRSCNIACLGPQKSGRVDGYLYKTQGLHTHFNVDTPQLCLKNEWVPTTPDLKNSNNRRVSSWSINSIRSVGGAWQPHQDA